MSKFYLKPEKGRRNRICMERLDKSGGGRGRGKGQGDS